MTSSCASSPSNTKCGSGFPDGMDAIIEGSRPTSPNCQAAATAETFAMQRMIRHMANRLTQRVRGREHRPTHKNLAQRFHQRSFASKTTGFSVAVFAATMLIAAPARVSAQGGVDLANYDMEASGYVTPAGMPPVAMMPSAGMMPGGPMIPGTTMMPGGGGMMPGSGVMPVGYNGPGCDSGCDAMPMMMGGQSMAVCSSCGGNGGCGCNGILGKGGLLGKLRDNGGPSCLFCRGQGCTACQDLPFGYMGSCLAGCCGMLKPWCGAKLCQQRWYDFSVEALVLDRGNGGLFPDVIATDGVAPAGVPVLTGNSLNFDDMEAGVRVSAAFICGPGGNIEVTYMGGNEWSTSARASSDTPSLFSYISGFGTTPINGLDDTDRSLVQSLDSRSDFHSGEVNYRLRTMFPYCRFQSSWLLGLRYVEFDDTLGYTATGLDNDTVNGNLPRFYNNTTSVENRYFGPQAGFDFWWNVCPGVSLGLGGKAAWVQNNFDRRSDVRANSLPDGVGGFVATSVRVDDKGNDNTVLGDFELKSVWRLSHSITIRSSYYVMAIDDVLFGGVDPTINPLELSDNLLNNTLPAAPRHFDDLVLQGFTLGMEYMW